ncbi:MAG: glycine cleavage system protein GcvH [Verrucomicrobia bacterium]|nr:glycine cleavage system protein GcvH [Verrucomicrobiota bacterium]
MILMKKYSARSEWAELQDGIATIGISQQAAAEIGEVVFVELPRIGSRVKAGQEVVVLESTKAAVDIYSPLSGEIVAVNEALSTKVDYINKSPEGEGWLFRLKLDDAAEFDTFR